MVAWVRAYKWFKGLGTLWYWRVNTIGLFGSLSSCIHGYGYSAVVSFFVNIVQIQALCPTLSCIHVGLLLKKVNFLMILCIKFIVLYLVTGEASQGFFLGGCLEIAKGRQLYTMHLSGSGVSLQLSFQDFPSFLAGHRTQDRTQVVFSGRY